MKKILFFLFLPAFALAKEPPKGTNTIIVRGVEFKGAMSKVMDANITIDRYDSVLHTFSIVPQTDRRNVTHAFYVRIKDFVAWSGH